MNNRDERLEETRQMFNSIGVCCDGQSLARLVGFSEDMLDYYYRLRTPACGDHKDVCWSAVGWFIPLRGAIPDRAYAFLEQVFTLNGCPPADEFLVTVATREENVAMYGEAAVARYEDPAPPT